MTDYVFLEHALNAEGTSELCEKNSALIDRSTIIIDELVEAEHSFVESHLGQFVVHEDLDGTYEKMQEPVGDLVIEAVNYFSMVIANEDMTVEEKTALIEIGATAIALEESPSVLLEMEGNPADGIFSSAVERIAGVFKNAPSPMEVEKMEMSLSDQAVSTFEKSWMAIVAFFTGLKTDVSQLGGDIAKSYNDVLSYFKNTDFLVDPTKNTLEPGFLDKFLSVISPNGKFDSGLVGDLSAAEYVPDWAKGYLINSCP